MTKDEEAALDATMKALEKPAPPAPPEPPAPPAAPPIPAAPAAKPAPASDLAPEGEHPLQLDCTGGTGGQVLIRLAPRQWVLAYKVGVDGKPVLTEKGWRNGPNGPGDRDAFAWVDRSKLDENPHIGVDVEAEAAKVAAAKAKDKPTK
jgi:hypothetical protein